MIRVNIQDAKTHLSRHLKRVEAGETVVICKRNQPIAEIRPVHQPRQKRRPIGLDKGLFTLGPEFFEPLPDDLLAAFNGEGPDDCR